MGMERTEDEPPPLAVYQTVRCLECDAVYSKPARGGTAKSNPGCPDCGYVGWVAVDVPVRAIEPPRSDEDLRQRRSARSR
jgi:hypothetical protein